MTEHNGNKNEIQFVSQDTNMMVSALQEVAERMFLLEGAIKANTENIIKIKSYVDAILRVLDTFEMVGKPEFIKMADSALQQTIKDSEKEMLELQKIQRQISAIQNNPNLPHPEA